MYDSHKEQPVVKNHQETRFWAQRLSTKCPSAQPASQTLHKARSPQRTRLPEAPAAPPCRSPSRSAHTPPATQQALSRAGPPAAAPGTGAQAWASRPPVRAHSRPSSGPASVPGALLPGPSLDREWVTAHRGEQSCSHTPRPSAGLGTGAAAMRCPAPAAGKETRTQSAGGASARFTVASPDRKDSEVHRSRTKRKLRQTPSQNTSDPERGEPLWENTGPRHDPSGPEEGKGTTRVLFLGPGKAEGLHVPSPGEAASRAEEGTQEREVGAHSYHKQQIQAPLWALGKLGDRLHGAPGAAPRSATAPLHAHHQTLTPKPFLGPGPPTSTP